MTRPSTAIYTCSIGGYDWTHRPAVKTPDVAFYRFSERKAWRQSPWQHSTLPRTPDAKTPRLITRYVKIFPHKVLPTYDLTIWVDSNIVILGDIRPLVEEFLGGGEDLAFFPHPSGRTISEEIDFAIAAGRIDPTFYEAASKQKERYQAANLAEARIPEATIIFYRSKRDAVKEACARWWYELSHYTERDQVSQPYAMRGKDLRIKYWNWHFADGINPYFRRVPHRPQSALTQLRTGAHFLGDYRFDYRMVRLAIRTASALRRATSRNNN